MVGREGNGRVALPFDSKLYRGNTGRGSTPLHMHKLEEAFYQYGAIRTTKNVKENEY